MMNRYTFRLVLTIFVVALSAMANFGQTTSFSYQGNLKSGGTDASGSHDFEFALFNAAAGGAQLGSTVTQNGVTVTNGIFAVTLDFGNQFPGASRFLEIRVRQAGGGSYTTLTPRQPVASSPYAIKSTNADAATTATNSTQLGGVAASQFVQTSDPRLNDARAPTAGSSNYVQNTTVQQTATNFNVSGTGTANILNAATQYNLGGNRIVSASNFNTFIGIDSGAANQSGQNNSFFGQAAGNSNTNGTYNSFFGKDTGFNNTLGLGNSFVGFTAGESNTFGSYNSFFGMYSGRSNTTADGNSFFGLSSGEDNTTGTANAFFGSSAGSNNVTGNSNAFFGRRAGFANTTGSKNTTIGDLADVGSVNLSYATAIGADAVVTTSNRIQLGRQDGSDDVRVSGNLLLATLGSAGTTALCRNIFQQVATCSSSLRYKTNLHPYGLGLNLINQLKPITFDWKDGGMNDLGLGAEDVAAIEPLLVTYNAKGEVEGVKYDRIGVVLVNAVKEQQQTIERQQKQIDALRSLVCASNREADICKEPR